jgi:uncharacterized membrane protein
MPTIRQIAYFPIFGKPLILYGGIVTFLSLIITASLGYLIYSGKAKIKIKWHLVAAGLTLGLALVHGLLGILSYL